MSRRPVVLLDCDGVLANFIQATLDGLQSVMPHNLTHDSITTWEVFDSFPQEAQQHRSSVYAYLKKEGGCLGIPLYPGSQGGVARLQNIADVIIVTSPFKGSKTWTHEREQWLEEYFNIEHTEVIHAKRKEFVRGDFLIDDKPENLQSWREAHPDGKPIYWKNPQFAGPVPGYVICTRSWDVVIDEVQRFIARSP